ncbi:hypothetical protein [Kitasatospora sp. NPDC001095]
MIGPSGDCRANCAPPPGSGADERHPAACRRAAGHRGSVAESRAARANGDGSLDHSALLRGVERLSGREVG